MASLAPAAVAPLPQPCTIIWLTLEIARAPPFAIALGSAIDGTPRASMDILLDDTPHGTMIIHEHSSLNTHPDAATTGAPPKFVLVEEEEAEDGGDGIGASRVHSAPMSLGASSSPGVQIHAAGSSATGGDPPFSPMSPQTMTTV